ncbi:MAG: hypothetical protein AAFY73_07145, partial [Pseudomonadota bacterium]
MARQEQNEIFAQTQFLDGANAVYIEQLYAKWQDNPSSVSEDWQAFFGQMGDAPAVGVFLHVGGG